MSLRLRPSTMHEANAHIRQHHSHHQPVRGCKFAVACLDGDRLCGVVVVERPKARMSDDGFTLELSRVCTDRTPHAASKLVAAATRASFAMGALRMISYVLEGEAGTSYRAAGWHPAADAEGNPEKRGGGRWDSTGRPRREPMADLLGLPPKAPEGPKHLWQRFAPGSAPERTGRLTRLR